MQTFQVTCLRTQRLFGLNGSHWSRRVDGCFLVRNSCGPRAMVDVIPQVIWCSTTYSRILFILTRGQGTPMCIVSYPNYPWSGGLAFFNLWQGMEMDEEGYIDRISRDRNRERYMERHFSILRMLPPGTNFWFGNSYSCIYTFLLTVMCLQTGYFPWTICEKRLLDEYRQLGEDIESDGSSLRCRMNLRGKRYKTRSKVWFVIWSLKSSRKKSPCGLLSNFFALP